MVRGFCPFLRVWGARWPLLGPGRVLLWPAGPGTRRENRRFPGRRSLYWHPTPRADSMSRDSSPCFAPRRPGGANWWRRRSRCPAARPARRPRSASTRSLRNRLGCQPRWLCRDGQTRWVAWCSCQSPRCPVSERALPLTPSEAPRPRMGRLWPRLPLRRARRGSGWSVGGSMAAVIDQAADPLVLMKTSCRSRKRPWIGPRPGPLTIGGHLGGQQPPSIVCCQLTGIVGPVGVALHTPSTGTP
jgi:hypothetical protein